MKKILIILCLLLQILSVKSQTQVDIHTNYGDVRLELYDALVPNTVNNFVSLINQGFYDGVIFHRVIDNFMIQGGDGFPAPPSIMDEFDSTLSNVQKTISMANSGPNTGTCQFFINLVDNTYLDFDKAPLTSKHPVFGITVSGFNVVQAIGEVQTNFNDVPYVDVVMDSVRIVNSNVGLENIISPDRNKLIDIIDFSGKSLNRKSSFPLIYIYENGLVEKKIIVK